MNDTEKTKSILLELADIPTVSRENNLYPDLRKANLVERKRAFGGMYRYQLTQEGREAIGA